MRQLRVGDRTVAEYVARPDVDSRLSPRPYLHPVRTLSGVIVSDLMPDDHPHHLGVSVGIQDVNKSNLWGGRTYVRGHGYTWLDDHGRICHEGFDTVGHDRLIERLSWRDSTDARLIDETRRLSVRPAPGALDAWVLDVHFELRARDRDVTLGSPATNGRPGGAGYGGFFWRIAPPANKPEVFTPTAAGESAVNGSAEAWVAFATEEFTLVFAGIAETDRWFVRVSGYPGVCAALAFDRPLTIHRGGTLHRSYTVCVADAAMSRSAAADVVLAIEEGASG